MFVTPAFAQTAGAASPAQGITSMLTLIVPMILIFYFLIWRPESKRRTAHQAMIANVRRGDQVVTAGGIIGKVSKVAEGGEIEIEIAQGVKVRVVAATISNVLTKGEPAKAE